MSKMLINEPPRIFSPALATALGDAFLAIVLQQIHWWCWNNEYSDRERFHFDGHWWTVGSYDEWQRRDFPWVSTPTIRRAVRKLEKMGLLISVSGVYDSFDHTKWYRVDQGAVSKLDERFDQSDQIGEIDLTSSARDQDTPAPVFERTPTIEHLKDSSSAQAQARTEEDVNTESKDPEPPKSPVVQDKGSNSTPRRPRSDDDPPAMKPPGTPDTARQRLPRARRWNYDECSQVFLEHIPRASALAGRLLWVIEHWTEAEIREALRVTAFSNGPCWKYFCKVLTGFDESPAAKSRRTGGGGIKAPPKTVFDDETLQWVEVES